MSNRFGFNNFSEETQVSVSEKENRKRGHMHKFDGNVDRIPDVQKPKEIYVTAKVAVKEVFPVQGETEHFVTLPGFSEYRVPRGSRATNKQFRFALTQVVADIKREGDRFEKWVSIEIVDD